MQRQCFRHINEENRHHHKNISKYDLRTYIIDTFGVMCKEFGLPRTTMEYAVFEAYTAFWNDPSSDFDFKTVKDRTYTIHIDGRKVKNGCIYIKNSKKLLKHLYPQSGKTVKEMNAKTKKMLDENTSIPELSSFNTSKVISITFVRTTKKLYLNNIMDNYHEEYSDRKPIICNDPGIRTFNAWYDTEKWGTAGDKVNKRLYAIIKRGDELRSKATRFMGSGNYHKRRRIYKACNRVNKKVTNIVADLHWKSIHFQTTNYETIIQPKLDYDGIMKAIGKCQCKIKARLNKRIFKSLSHYRYTERLKYKCSQRHCNLIFTDEPYTTKTCPNCYESNVVGASKLYCCGKCGFIGDRDYVGCHNNLSRVIFALPDGAFSS